MGIKGMFMGAFGQKLDDKLKAKLEGAVTSAIEDDGITEFYFYNQQTSLEDDGILIFEAQLEQKKISEYIASKVNEYKKDHTENKIKVALIVALPKETDYNSELYDEIIQAYYIYSNDLNDEDDCDAYTLCENYIAKNIDMFVWYSNSFLLSTMSFKALAESNDKIIKSLYF